uniref:Vomeronasal type-1 receptor n=1 Tax=Nannospalax galili TaxID=1026970 RepID=A0A4Y1N4P4_NANGA|nr:vomeronasal type 1 receptor 9 [Nannospalax galili]AWV49662.1 vomeronasal type 1 receptor 9 [Nannospalax galili]
MAARDLAMGFIFLSQTALGILGKSVLLYYFILTGFTGIREKPTDLIVKHLTWANFMVLLFKGVPHTIAAFSQTHFLNPIVCKLVFYFHRVARGVSLGSTALLTIYQAIIISPSNSKLAQLNVSAPKFVGPSLCLCWALYLLVNGFIPLAVTDIGNIRNLSRLGYLVYCTVAQPQKPTSILYVILLTYTDILCLGLMMWSSGSMVCILLKHKQKVQHIHRSPSLRSSAEARATQNILTLGSSYVLFYVTSVILTMVLPFHGKTSVVLANANASMTACFPAFCPFILIRHYTGVPRVCCTCVYKQQIVLV